jgi:predicted DNA-binding protein
VEVICSLCTGNHLPIDCHRASGVLKSIKQGSTPLINFRLDPAVTARLDDAALRSGLTRSEWIRRAIDLFLNDPANVARRVGRTGSDPQG